VSLWWQSLGLRGLRGVVEKECMRLQQLCKHEKALRINNIKIWNKTGLEPVSCDVTSCAHHHHSIQWADRFNSFNSSFRSADPLGIACALGKSKRPYLRKLSPKEGEGAGGEQGVGRDRQIGVRQRVTLYVQRLCEAEADLSHPFIHSHSRAVSGFLM